MFDYRFKSVSPSLLFPAVSTHRAIKDTHCIAPIVMEELLPAYVYYLTRNKGRTRVRRSRLRRHDNGTLSWSILFKVSRDGERGHLGDGGGWREHTEP